MPNPSRRKLILLAVMAALQKISVTNGYETDAGARVLMGETPTFGEHDPRVAVAVIVGDTEERNHGNAIIVKMPISVQAFAAVSTGTTAAEQAEDVIADIKRAMEEDRTLGGTVPDTGIERVVTRPALREAGSDMVGGAVDYMATFKEHWGNP